MARREPKAQRVRPLARLRRPWIIGGVAGLAVILGVVLWLVWPERSERTPRALEYQDFDVCLLVDSGGIHAGPAAAAWAEMREVVTDANVRLSYLSVTGPQTVEQATLFVPTLVQQGCDVVVAIGSSQVAAVRAVMPTYPDVQFFTVESDADVDGVAAQVSSLLPST